MNTACCLLLVLCPLSPHCLFPFVWNVFNDFSNAVSIVVIKILSEIHFFSIPANIVLISSLPWCFDRREKEVCQRSIKEFQIFAFLLHPSFYVYFYLQYFISRRLYLHLYFLSHSLYRCCCLKKRQHFSQWLGGTFYSSLLQKAVFPFHLPHRAAV